MCVRVLSKHIKSQKNKYNQSRHSQFTCIAFHIRYSGKEGGENVSRLHFSVHIWFAVQPLASHCSPASIILFPQTDLDSLEEHALKNSINTKKIAAIGIIFCFMLWRIKYYS